MKTNQILSILSDCGVYRAAVLPQTSVVYNPVFREICAKNTCGGYGTCYMCPPDIGPLDELMAAAQRFPRCVMYQNVYEIEDSFDYEGMVDAKKNHHHCAQQIQAVLKPLANQPFLHLEAGGCGICQRCAKRDQLPCRFPEKALSSLEAYGIDVYNTASNAGLKYVNGQNTITYFGILMLPEEDDA